MTLVEPPMTLVEPPMTLVEPPMTLVEPPMTLVEPPMTLVEPPAPTPIGVLWSRLLCQASTASTIRSITPASSQHNGPRTASSTRTWTQYDWPAIHDSIASTTSRTPCQVTWPG